MICQSINNSKFFNELKKLRAETLIIKLNKDLNKNQ